MPQESSILAYKTRLDFLERHKVKTNSAMSLIRFFDKQDYSVATRRSYINACIHKHKDDEKTREALNKILKPLSETLKSDAHLQKASEKQKENFVPWDEIKKKGSMAMKNEALPLEDRIMIGLYTELPPVRLDYTKMTLKDKLPKESKLNFFVCNSKEHKVVINEYKEAHIHGSIINDIPAPLCALVNSYFNENDILFDMSPNQFGRKLKKVFTALLGKPTTATSLRHSFITYMFKDAPTLLESQELAKSMGHAVSTQALYRFTNTDK
jgi:integrase